MSCFKYFYVTNIYIDSYMRVNYILVMYVLYVNNLLQSILKDSNADTNFSVYFTNLLPFVSDDI